MFIDDITTSTTSTTMAPSPSPSPESVSWTESIIAFLISYMTPAVWIQALPRAFCWVCTSKSRYVTSFAGLINFFVIIVILAFIAKVFVSIYNCE